jgi:hypothetical protein
MTVQSTTARASYSGNGATKTFPVPFYFFDASHVSLALVATDPYSIVPPKTLVLNSDYSVAGAGNSQGGSVTLNAAPPAGMQLVVSRAVPFTQLVKYVPNDPFPAATHEQALDQLTMAVQQLLAAVQVSIRAPDFETPQLVLPPKAQRAGMVLGFDSAGNLTLYPIKTYNPPSPGVMFDEMFQVGINFTPGVTTTLPLSQDYGSASNLLVHFDAAFQGKNTYALVGKNLTFSEPIPYGVQTVFVRGGATAA